MDDLGYIYITGETENNSGNYKTFIAKYDSTGHLVWNEIWGGLDAEVSNSIVIDDSKYIYFADYLESYLDAFIVKFNDEGNLVDELIWGGSHNFITTDIALDDTVNIYITGSNSTDIYNYDAFIA
jgi:hypothetical protein